MDPLSTEKLSLLAEFLTQRSRSFEDTLREFVLNFHRTEWIMVTKALAVLLHNRPFECTGQKLPSTKAEFSSDNTEEKTNIQAKNSENLQSELVNPSIKCYALEHAYACVILSLTDACGLVAGNELAKVEYLLKERIILSTKNRHQEMPENNSYVSLQIMKALWLFGGKIPSDILAMNVNEYFSMTVSKLTTLFLVPPLSEASQSVTVYPLSGMPRIMQRPHHEGSFLSHSSMCELLCAAQTSGISHCVDAAYPPRIVPTFMNVADLCQYVFSFKESSTSSRSPQGDDKESNCPKYTAFLATLRKGCSSELRRDEESAMINFTVRCPEILGMSGITPANIMALINSKNVRIASAILQYYSSTRLFSLFLSPFLHAKNLNPCMYELLLCLSVEKHLPESFLVEFLELGFNEFGFESSTPADFSSENESFATFCTDLLKHCAIRPSLIFDDVCRYCVLHQCTPKTLPLFSLIISCSSWV